MKDNIGEDSLQLAIYALAVQEIFRCDIESILLFKAYLERPEIKEFNLSEQMIEKAKVRIIQSAESMASPSIIWNTWSISIFLHLVIFLKSAKHVNFEVSAMIEN